MKLRIKVSRSQECDIKTNLQEVYYESSTEMKEGFFYYGQEKATPPLKKIPKTQTCCYNLNIYDSDWALKATDVLSTFIWCIPSDCMKAQLLSLLGSFHPLIIINFVPHLLCPLTCLLQVAGSFPYCLL